jgi:hypothetical protein
LPPSYRITIVNTSGFNLCETLRKDHPASIIDICVPILNNDFQVIQEKLVNGITCRVINNVSFYHDFYAGSVHSAKHLQPISLLADELNFNLTHYQYWEFAPFTNFADSRRVLTAENERFNLILISPDLIPISLSILESLVDPEYHFPISESMRSQGVIVITGRPWCTASNRYGSVYNFGGPEYARSLATITSGLLSVARELIESENPHVIYCPDFRVKQDVDYKHMLEILSDLSETEIIDSSLFNFQYLTMDCWIPRLTRETQVALISYDSSTAASLAMCGCQFTSVLGCTKDLLIAQGTPSSSIEYIQMVTNKTLELIQATEYGRLAKITHLDGMVIHKLS